jgi:hypothetical protein
MKFLSCLKYLTGGMIMNINEYADKVIELNSIISENIVCERLHTEIQAMLNLIDVEIDRIVEEDTWSQIINAISEAFIFDSVSEFLPEKCLNYLIDNRIDLVGLSHLNLEEKWFVKILDVDSSIWEAEKNLKNNSK